MTVNIQVDGRHLAVKTGTSVLRACLDNGIFIPNLCHVPALAVPQASCRLCFVEIEGTRLPVASCTVPVTEAMVVRTDTQAVRRLQRSGLRLLLSVHHVDCKNCPANRRCALQNMARFLDIGLKPKGLVQYLKAQTVDRSHPFIDHFPNRCVLCGQCIHACPTTDRGTRITYTRRGFDTVISLYGASNSGDSPCLNCRACVSVCPVGALQEKPLPPQR